MKLEEAKIKNFKSHKEKLVIILDIFAIIIIFLYIIKNKDTRILELINIFDDDFTVKVF